VEVQAAGQGVLSRTRVLHDCHAAAPGCLHLETASLAHHGRGDAAAKARRQCASLPRLLDAAAGLAIDTISSTINLELDLMPLALCICGATEQKKKHVYV